jgi:DNA-directed RNA polymerase specialized sigma subunit
MTKYFTDNEIENILKSYKRLKLQSIIDQEKLYGMFPSCVAISDGMPHAQGKISRQTENFGIANAESKDYLETKIKVTCGQVRVIELVYDSLTSDCRDLVKTHYFERKSKNETLCELNISRDQFGRLKRQSLNEINENLSKTCQKPVDFAVGC